MADPRATEPRRLIDISTASIVRVLAAVVLVWLWLHLWQLLMLVIVAGVIAIGLEPIVEWLESRRIPRGIGASASVLVLALIVVGFFWITGASLAEQARGLGGDFQSVRSELGAKVPEWVRQAVHPKNAPAGGSLMAGYAFDAGRLALQALVIGVMAFILTIYMLIEGRQTYVWLLAYAPPRYRDRINYTALQAREKIHGYIVANVVTSACAAATVFVTMSLLKVPAALLLAVLAGVFDFVPVIGFICSSAPALLLAATQSAGLVVAVAAVYAGYHLAENYYIGPKIYGGRLRLSNLAVIIAFAVGAEIGGIVGALLALPLAALYPVIERVWLSEYLSRGALDTHRRLEHTKDSRPA